jgi:carotenoid 1,2-hydratase
MITLSDPRVPLDAAYLDAPGGFLWWYVDLLDDAGNGFVLIWSFGLPFLPGYMQAARRSRPEAPRERPSLNVALYRDGKPTFYLLQEYSRDDAEWMVDGDRETWRFGRSRIESVMHAGNRTVSVALDCPVPAAKAPLTGEITLSGCVPRLRPSDAIHVGPRHEWCPVVGPAECRARFVYDAGEELVVSGLAYHDRNGGDAPLDRLGIREWTWGRVVDAGALAIHYVVWPEEVGAAPLAWSTYLAADGEAHHVAHAALELEPAVRAVYGMRYVPQMSITSAGPAALGEGRTSITTESIVDDGPFYLRTLTRTARSGRAHQLGFSEWVRPSRIDLDHHRPFVRMRVHDVEGPNSIWLPLFSGPRRGRVKRLFGLGG